MCSDLKPLEGTYIDDFSSKGALLSIKKDFQGPTLISDKYMLFGRVDITFQAAPGAGIITSIVLMSCDKDEIDWELVGNDVTQIQSNYFSKGNETTYDRGGKHAVSDPVGTEHTYSLEWTRSKIDWIIDGVTVRTAKASDAKDGYGFPQTPAQVKAGIWVGGNGKANNYQLEWAGGKADFSKAPFNAYVKRVKIVDYAGGDSPSPNKVDSYTYGDRSGSLESIQFSPKGSGNVGGVSDSHNKAVQAEESSSSSASSASASASASSTGSASKSSTTVAASSNATHEATSSSKSESASKTASTPAVETGKSGAGRLHVAAGAALVAGMAVLFASL